MSGTSPGTIDRSTLLGGPFDPFHFYEWLPSDGVRIEPPPSGNAVALVELLLTCPLDDGAIALLDELTVLLLHAGATIPASQRWQNLADRLARRYAALLPYETARPLRMRLQRLNFCLRDTLDRDQPISFRGQRQLAGRNPWDWLDRPDGTLCILSDTENLHWRPHRGPGWRARCGLPTQLDALDDGSVSVGSTYSPGGWMVHDGQPIAIEHDAPVVLAFSFQGELHLLDSKGQIIVAASGKRRAALAVRNITRARLFDGKLHAVDWSRPDILIVHDLASGWETAIDTRPVIICNDLCRLDDRYYLIDKEQGSVFVFDACFRYLERHLAFGKGEGRLYDPIAIHPDGGGVSVLSWFEGRIVAL